MHAAVAKDLKHMSRFFDRSTLGDLLRPGSLHPLFQCPSQSARLSEVTVPTGTHRSMSCRELSAIGHEGTLKLGIHTHDLRKQCLLMASSTVNPSCAGSCNSMFGTTSRYLEQSLASTLHPAEGFMQILRTGLQNLCPLRQCHKDEMRQSGFRKRSAAPNSKSAELNPECDAFRFFGACRESGSPVTAAVLSNSPQYFAQLKTDTSF